MGGSSNIYVMAITHNTQLLLNITLLKVTLTWTNKATNIKCVSYQIIL